MSKIIVLPENLSRKIAAGEVIERPSSVVKELVENALDARATDIRVELQAGGKRLIRMIDNGEGMSREDALLCFERHSTSKINSEEDLSRIATLGFRGEALPSISAVSRIILKTAEGVSQKGVLIEREAQTMLRIEEVAFPKGTSIEVRDLFFNLPARRKFLRTERSELGHSVKFLSAVALVHPGVRFLLKNGSRIVFDYLAVAGLRERIYQIYGKSVLNTLIPVDYGEDQRSISGYTSKPPNGRGDRKHQIFFVNKRPVKEKILHSALNRAYQSFLERDRFPEAFLFLTVPFEDVDVNVHPAKTEVRFKDSSLIFNWVRRSLEQALLREMGVKAVYPAGLQESKITGVEEKGFYPSFPPMKETKRDGHISGTLFPQKSESASKPKILGQYLDSYIVAVDSDGILVIDQHNAHERVLFEKYQSIHNKNTWPRKLALDPVIFDLSPRQKLALEKNQILLERIGFRVDMMGKRSYALKEYPDFFRENEAKEIFLSLLEEISHEKVEDRLNKILATMACKTAVKAGESMSKDKMDYLVEQLFQTKIKSLCPHGRPVLIRLSKKDIEKGIGRPQN
jgi:DNA mismatch repair protein MutL